MCVTMHARKDPAPPCRALGQEGVVMNMKKYFEQGMLALLERKGIDSITVAEIIEEVGSCKGTFYKHYIDKYHLCCQSLQNYIYGGIPEESKSWEELIMQCLAVFEKHDKVILHAFDSEDINSPKNYFNRLLSEFFVRNCGGEPDAAMNTLAIRLYCANVTDLILRWLSGGCKESRPEVFHLISAVMPQAIFKIFLTPVGVSAV